MVRGMNKILNNPAKIASEKNTLPLYGTEKETSQHGANQAEPTVQFVCEIVFSHACVEV